MDRIWLPGEQSHEKRARYGAQGIPIANLLLDELDALAADLGIAPLDKQTTP